MQKILFNDRLKLTDAVINRTKTMTHRSEKLENMESFIGWYTDEVKDGEYYRSFVYKDKDGNTKRHKCKYGFGEIVAVGQSYKDAGYSEYDIFAGDLSDGCSDGMEWDRYYCEVAGWNNKMFVLPNLMTHQIKITGIKIERLQDISDEDCIKEGVCRCNNCPTGCYLGSISDYFHCGNEKKSAREAFASLIDELKKGTWEANNWNIVYEFELIK